MSTDDQTDTRSDDVDNISFSATELDDIVSSAEITEESVADDDLEEYGVWVKVGPEAVTDAPDVLATAGDDTWMTDLDDAEEDFLTDEEESLLGVLGDAGLDEAEVATSIEPPVVDAGDELDLVDVDDHIDADLDLDIPDVEDLVEGEKREEALELDTDFGLDEVDDAAVGSPFVHDDGIADSIDVPLSDDTSTDAGEFQDLAALEEDLPGPTTEATGPAELANNGGDTATLLAKMERELLAIMREITDVKRELAELRKSGIGGEAKEESTGFFDGDEDETIALTGAELDNILSSADITEEVAESALEPDGAKVDTADTYDLAQPEPEATADAFDLEESELPAEEESIDLDVDVDAEPTAIVQDSLIDQDDLLAHDLELLDPDEPAAADSVSDDSAIDASAEIELDLSELEPDAPVAPERALADTPVEELAPSADEFILDEPDDIELSAEPDELLLDEPLADRALAPVEELLIDESELAEVPEIELELVEELTADEAEEDSLEMIEPATEFSVADETTSESFDPATMESTFVDEPEIELEPAAATADVQDVDLNIYEDAQPLDIEEAQPLDLDLDAGATALDIEEIEDVAEVDTAVVDATDGGPAADAITLEGGDAAVPDDLKQDIKSVLAYLDQLLDALPEDKIEEFAQSEHFGVYKKLFEELGLED